jgi:O-antigen ligase
MSSPQLAPSQRSIMTWLGLIAIGVAVGVVVSFLTPVISDLHRRFVALGILSIFILVAALAKGKVREMFLFTWVVSLTYNRQFWSFVPIVGDHGAFGPYWMISDLLLLVLLAHWVYCAAILKHPQRVQGSRFMQWYAPFAIVAVLSVVGTREPVWALSDLVRLAKLGLVLMYFRYNVGPREWWVVVTGLGTAITLQSILGVLGAVFGRLGVLSIFGLGGAGEAASFGIDDIYPEGFIRAEGTFAHAPYMGAFLVLTVPLFMSLAFTLPKGLSKWICVGVTGMGLIGLAFTLARAPIVIMLGQAVILVILLSAMRLIPVTRAIALGAFAGLLFCIVGIMAADLLYERLTSNLESSISQRFSEYRVAVKMLLDHPLFGIGLNNYAAYMQEYGSESIWGLERKWHDVATQMTHMRVLAGPLNGYLYVATVTGLVGLTAFLWLAFGALRLGWRAVKTSTGAVSAACLGMVVGMLGLYLTQITSYSIWTDSVIATWIVVLGLVGCAADHPERRVVRKSVA